MESIDYESVGAGYESYYAAWIFKLHDVCIMD